VIDKLYKDTAQAIQGADIRGRFEQIGMVPVGNPPDAFAQDIRSESARWAKIIKERKLQVD
jgi:tripartite-type tricarboxylate transporter receptor subunit TctC